MEKSIFRITIVHIDVSSVSVYTLQIVSMTTHASASTRAHLPYLRTIARPNNEWSIFKLVILR